MFRIQAEKFSGFFIAALIFHAVKSGCHGCQCVLEFWKYRLLFCAVDNCQEGEECGTDRNQDGFQGEWFPIGDVTLSQDNLPIVIGNPAYQHRGLGKKILSALIELARVKGWKELRVKEIYTYNHVSRCCFKSLGFVENGATEKGMSFILKLI